MVSSRIFSASSSGYSGTLSLPVGRFPADGAKDLPGFGIPDLLETAWLVRSNAVAVCFSFSPRRVPLLSGGTFPGCRYPGKAVCGIHEEPDLPDLLLASNVPDSLEQRRCGQLEFLGPRMVPDKDRQYAVSDLSRGRLVAQEGPDDLLPGPEKTHLDRGGGQTERVRENRFQDRRQVPDAHRLPFSARLRALPPAICPPIAQRMKKGMSQEVTWLAILR